MMGYTFDYNGVPSSPYVFECSNYGCLTQTCEFFMENVNLTRVVFDIAHGILPATKDDCECTISGQDVGTNESIVLAVIFAILYTISCPCGYFLFRKDPHDIDNFFTILFMFPPAACLGIAVKLYVQ